MHAEDGCCSCLKFKDEESITVIVVMSAGRATDAVTTTSFSCSASAPPQSQPLLPPPPPHQRPRTAIGMPSTAGHRLMNRYVNMSIRVNAN